jgi:hypothetical protein
VCSVQGLENQGKLGVGHDMRSSWHLHLTGSATYALYIAERDYGAVMPECRHAESSSDAASINRRVVYAALTVMYGVVVTVILATPRADGKPVVMPEVRTASYAVHVMAGCCTCVRSIPRCNPGLTRMAITACGPVKGHDPLLPAEAAPPLHGIIARAWDLLVE